MEALLVRHVTLDTLKQHSVSVLDLLRTRTKPERGCPVLHGEALNHPIIIGH